MKELLLVLLIGVTSIGYSQKLYKAVEKEDFGKVKSLVEKGEDVSEYSKKRTFSIMEVSGR